MTKYLLVRPESGLNDMLTQIEVGCLYGQNSGRVVVVDTAHPSSKHFRDDFSHYFVSIDPNLHLSVDPFVDTFDRVSVYPPFLAGRVSNYNIENSEEYSCWVETETKLPIRISFDQGYDEELIVHQHFGGANVAINALCRLQLQSWLIDLLYSRLCSIGESFTALHIRNTDLKTNYDVVLETIQNMNIGNKLFLATDSSSVLQKFKQVLGDQVVSFADIPSGDSPLHYCNSNPRQANTDAILDLLTIACSKSYLLTELSNCNYARVSGFSILAHNLFQNKFVLQNLLRSDSRFKFS